MLQDVKLLLGKCFALKDLGEAAYIPGIKIYRDRSRWLIGLSQNAYIERILKRFKMDASEHGSLPMQHNVVLSKNQEHFTYAEVKPYASLVGSIMYVNILKYLRNTKDMFLVYGAHSKIELSVTCSVDWKSSKQNTTVMSSTKAKYVVASEAVMEPIQICKFIYGLGVVPSNDRPMDMYCDNTGAITIVNEHGVQKGAKHYR
ncbi:hypothetical protein Tco_1575913 [Tanacetum coccineum]